MTYGVTCDFTIYRAQVSRTFSFLNHHHRSEYISITQHSHNTVCWLEYVKQIHTSEMASKRRQLEACKFVKISSQTLMGLMQSNPFIDAEASVDKDGEDEDDPEDDPEDDFGEFYITALFIIIRNRKTKKLLCVYLAGTPELEYRLS
jgi:hypothetical protein